MQFSLRRFFQALPGLLLGTTLVSAQGLFSMAYPTAPRPVPAVTPAIPAGAETAAYPVQPAAGIDFSGLTSGMVQQTRATSGSVVQNPYMIRLEEERRLAEQEYQDAVASGNTQATRQALVRLMTAEGRLTAVQRQPGAMFFPSFAAEEELGSLEEPGGEDDPQTFGLLPGGMRRLVFFREYVRVGRYIQRWVDGNVQVRTGQDGEESELAVFMLKTPMAMNFPISKDKDSKDPSGYLFEGSVPDKRDPTRMVDAWKFDSSKGNPKSRERIPLVNIRNDGSFEGVYDANNIRVARIKQEYYQENGQRVVQRTYYREGRELPIASMVESTYNGDPCLNLRNAGGPGAQTVFQFVFSGWLPGTTRKNRPLDSDADFRKALGRFVDAWVTTEAWRKKVGISHDFGAQEN